MLLLYLSLGDKSCAMSLESKYQMFWDLYFDCYKMHWIQTVYHLANLLHLPNFLTNCILIFGVWQKQETPESKSSSNTLNPVECMLRTFFYHRVHYKDIIDRTNKVKNLKSSTKCYFLVVCKWKFHKGRLKRFCAMCKFGNICQIMILTHT